MSSRASGDARALGGARAVAVAAPRYDVVVPSAGRASLGRLLAGLASGRGESPVRTIVVDDRGEPRRGALAVPAGVEVLASGGRGPAAARNVGWRAASAEWVAFLDDDVIARAGWSEALARDLASLGPNVAASQGRVAVPLPAGRRPTDRERGVAGLEDARWATADMAFRRSALAAVGGFDERFGRAYREDSDLGLRLLDAGFEIVVGARRALHPVPAARATISLRAQAGNADDALMRALHGRAWRARAGAPRGRLRRHAAVTAAGAAGLVGATLGRRRAGAAALSLWAAGTAELAYARIAPGPRTPGEVATMLGTSALMPPLATYHRARGWRRARRLVRQALPLAVLVDRDGTLIEDVPYCREPARVRPLPGARRALERLRSRGVKLAVISNQSGIARGALDESELEAVNARVEELLGPLGPWLICPHGPRAGCDCRKPEPGLVLRAAGRLGVPAERCAVIGDIGADVQAALAAGARPLLVPTPSTRAEEIEAAPEVAPTLSDAVDRLLGGRAR